MAATITASTHAIFVNDNENENEEEIYDELTGDRLYLAGTVAPAGKYVRVEATWRPPIELLCSDYLPASLDGSVAHYRLVPALTCCYNGPSAGRR